MSHGTTIEQPSGTSPALEYRRACAQWLAEQGLHVFPLQPRSKVPRSGESWPSLATTDPQQVAHWFAADHNIGVACGPSRLLVVDEDEPGAFAQFAADRGESVPDTFTVITGRGRHFWYRQPEGEQVANTAGLGGLHLDLRGDGGYVVGPGSVHASGETYRPEDWNAPIAPCPEWLAQACAKNRVRAEVSSRGVAVVRPSEHPWSAPWSWQSRYSEPAPEGERHERARDLAYLLRQRVDYEIAALAMRAWFAAVEQPPAASGHYPWSDAERALRDAYGKAAEERFPVPDAGDGNREPDEEPLYADVASLLATGPIEPPKPTVLARRDGHCLFYEGRVNVLIGDSEAGKTFVGTAALAETLLAGGSALVVDADHNTVQAIIGDLMRFGVPAEVLSDLSRFRYTDAEDASRLRQVITDAKKWKPEIALIDCVGEVMAMFGLNSNSPDDYTHMHATILKPLAAKGITVVAVDHPPKSPDSKALGASGTHAKKRTVGGTALRVKVDQQFTPKKGGSCWLTIHKDRHGGLRAHCPVGEREPLAGRFVLTETGDQLGWSISAPKSEESQQVEREDAGGSPEDVQAVAALAPPAKTVEDVRLRLGWRKERARVALKTYRESAVPGSQPPCGEPGTDDAALVCDICGTTEGVIRWAEPWFVIRCKTHNPMTWSRS